MPISTGVSGVVKNNVHPSVGVAGVVRKVTQGYVGVNGVVRPFLTPISAADIQHVLIEITSISLGTVDSGGKKTEKSTNWDDLSSYGSVSIVGSSKDIIEVTTNQTNYVTAKGAAYVVLMDGAKVSLKDLSLATVSIFLYAEYYRGLSNYSCQAFGASMSGTSDDYEESVSEMFDADLSNNQFSLSTAQLTGGTSTVRLYHNHITVDGVENTNVVINNLLK